MSLVQYLYKSSLDKSFSFKYSVIYLNTLSWLFSFAKKAGVLPSPIITGFLSSASSIRILQTSKCPQYAAMRRGVIPSSF